MCDNEYLAHVMVKERLREAEARGVFNAMLREAASAGQVVEGAGVEHPRRLDLWWQAPTAWLAHLTLPKIWNRL